MARALTEIAQRASVCLFRFGDQSRERGAPGVAGTMIGRYGTFLLGLIASFAVVVDASAQRLRPIDVARVVSQAAHEADARGVKAIIAVSDRVGNVLAVYRMNRARRQLVVTSRPERMPNPPARGGLDGLTLAGGAKFAAIAKALTGAYLSSSRGNAFTTRTAGQIVQEHFNPGERGRPAGPLFGVQFSQLPCSDLMHAGSALGPGPRRSPLGLSADPGGLPLYRNGTLVGGIGVEIDGVYTFDRQLTDYDRDIEEIVAVAGQSGYTPPRHIWAMYQFVEGKSLRYTDVDARFLRTDPRAAPRRPRGGSYVGVPGYYPGTGARAGRPFGAASSGFRPAAAGAFGGLPAFVLDDGQGVNRFPPTPSAMPKGLRTREIRVILTEALRVATRARAQIRRPLGSHAHVTISVVDRQGRILGVVRSTDGPVFGTDVSLQKARTAAFFSREAAGAELSALGPGIRGYVRRARALLGPSALRDGTAFADRSGGNLSRPFFPDGIDGNPPGPFSRPIHEWSPFNTGLQLDLVLADIAARLDGSQHPASGCTGLPQADGGLEADTGFSRASSAGFDPMFYARKNPDAVRAVQRGRFDSLMAHYRTVGERQGRRASAVFDARFYTTQNPDVAALVRAGRFGTALEHYDRRGRKRGLIGAQGAAPGAIAPGAAAAPRRLANGLQIFPGSVPIYRGRTLIGGIGVSGDGIDQDDLIAFLGLHNASLRAGNGLGNAPPQMRADRLAPRGVHLRYVNCSTAPFLDSNVQDVCEGK